MGSPKQVQPPPSDIIVLSGETISLADALKARAETAAANLRNYCNNIRTPHFLLEDIHVDSFIKTATANSLYENMKSTLCVQQPEHYERAAEEVGTDDIQIIFEGQAGPHNIGHYICIHYVAAERTVYVYDSLYYGKLTKNNSRKVIDRRYPQGTKVVFVEPKTKQPDGTSCGVFAAAYATTLILGRDPAEYPLLLQNHPSGDKTLQLRRHLASILEEDRLSLFPTGTCICLDFF